MNYETAATESINSNTHLKVHCQDHYVSPQVCHNIKWLTVGNKVNNLHSAEVNNESGHISK